MNQESNHIRVGDGVIEVLEDSAIVDFGCSVEDNAHAAARTLVGVDGVTATSAELRGGLSDPATTEAVLVISLVTDKVVPDTRIRVAEEG